MKYYLDLLKNLERGEIAPVYLFYGEEGYLRAQGEMRFRQALQPAELADFNLDLLDGEVASGLEIVSRAETPPFMAARRLVVVRHARFFTGQGKSKSAADGEDEPVNLSPGEQALLDYLKDPLPTTCLILNTGYPVDKRRRLFKAVKNAGQVVEFTPLTPRDITRWLSKQARQAGLAIEPEAAALLIERVGRSLFLLASEMEKLTAFAAGGKTISVEDVRRITVPRAEENIFAVVDAIGERRPARALDGIRELLAAGQPGPVIVAMIARQFRLLLQAIELREAGCPAAELARRLEVHPFVARKLSAQAGNFTCAQAAGALRELLALDAAVKSGRQEFYPAMEMFVLLSA
ncbi:DNA polymerase III subunit delta [Desulfotomaculum copahuensis]|uniref:DNA polymerase III subunit delta n=1 Tax=Desulfotomaculum copahuensis TaxID=1838280 RepID=A0A1B7LFC1_9FIRM|nr:DNA polymerase III subunit delta [Desulfotomaculum copahuensis]OAT82318.1 DNA polymerase III subunit delta [Desulfotomaculum copahuensis]